MWKTEFFKNQMFIKLVIHRITFYNGIKMLTFGEKKILIFYLTIKNWQSKNPLKTFLMSSLILKYIVAYLIKINFIFRNAKKFEKIYQHFKNYT